MRRIQNASIYHGFRGQLPELPSDDLAKSLVINRLHGLSPTSNDGSTFEQYLARKARSDPPRKTPAQIRSEASKQNVPSSTSSSPSHIDDRTNAFLAMYGIEPSEIKIESKPSGMKPDVSFERSLMYNPDRDRILLPPSDMDAKMYDILTPIDIKEASYVVYDDDTFCVDDLVPIVPVAISNIQEKLKIAEVLIEPALSVASVVQPIVEVSTVEISDDEGYGSEPSNACTPRGSNPGTITSQHIQFRTWYTGCIRRLSRKGDLRLYVKLRRRHHGRLGVHRLHHEEYPRDQVADVALDVRY